MNHFTIIPDHLSCTAFALDLSGAKKSSDIEHDDKKKVKAAIETWLFYFDKHKKASLSGSTNLRFSQYGEPAVHLLHPLAFRERMNIPNELFRLAGLGIGKAFVTPSLDPRKVPEWFSDGGSATDKCCFTQIYVGHCLGFIYCYIHT